MSTLPAIEETEAEAEGPVVTGAPAAAGVCMITLTDVRHDMRIRKQAETASRRHATAVVSHLRPGAAARELDGIDVIDVPLPSRRLRPAVLRWLVRYLLFSWRAFNAARRTGARLFHGHELAAALPAWLAARSTGGRFIYDAHELELDLGKGALQRVRWLHALARFVVRFLLRRADAVICASDDRAEVMLADYGVRERPLPILNVTPREGLPGGAPVSLPGGIDLPDDAVTVVYQGGLTPGRGLPEVVSALARLPERYVLLVVGGGADRPAIERRIAAEGVGQRVALIGHVAADEVRSWMRLGDVGIVIYQNTCRNNFHCAPNKLYDYCAVGVPVVGSDFPGVRAIVEPFEIGALFDPTDAASIADAILDVTGDPARHARFAAAAEKLREHVNWEQQEDRLLDLYRRLTNDITGGR